MHLVIFVHVSASSLVDVSGLFEVELLLRFPDAALIDLEMLYRSVFWVEILVAAVTGDPNEVDALVAHVIHEAVVILQRAVLLGVHCRHWVDG